MNENDFIVFFFPLKQLFKKNWMQKKYIHMS